MRTDHPHPSDDYCPRCSKPVYWTRDRDDWACSDPSCEERGSHLHLHGGKRPAADLAVVTMPALFTPGYIFELDTAVFECDYDIAESKAVTGVELDALEANYHRQEAFNDSVTAAVEHAFLFGASS